MTFSKATCKGGEMCPDEMTLERFCRCDLDEARMTAVETAQAPVEKA